MGLSNNLNTVYEKVFTKSTDGLLVANSNRQIKKVNKNGEQLLGYKKNELLSKTLDDIIPEEFHRECRKLCENLISRSERQKSLKIIITLQKKDGSKFPAEINICNLSDPLDGMILVGTFTDITQRRGILKALSESEKRFAQVFKSNPAPMLITRLSDGQIMEVNDSFLQLSSLSEKKVIGKTSLQLNIFTNKKDIENIHELLFREGHIKNYEVEMITAERKKIVVLLSTEIMELNHEKHFISTFIDITEKKKNEVELKIMNESLESKVKERTLKLTQSLEREKANHELKLRFITLASHEFRTPLATILSSLHLLDRYTQNSSEESRKKHTERIKAAVNHLTDILNDLLSLDNLDNGKTKLSESVIRIKEFTGKIIQEINYQLKENQIIDVNYHGEKLARTDEKIVRSVLVNLITNACRFSRSGQRISVIIDVSTDYLTVNVKDQGIGIPESDQKHIFMPLFRAKNAENIPGTGLGLSITKKYVELAEGSINFSSQENLGSTFSVKIPLNRLKLVP